MLWLYTATFIVGFGFIIPMLLTGFGSGDIGSIGDVGSADIGSVGDLGDIGSVGDVGDIGGFGDLDLSVEGGGLADVADISEPTPTSEVGSALDGVSELLGSILSLRSAIFASGFFGLAGLLFTWANRPEPIPFLMGSIFAVLAAVGNGFLYNLITNTEADSYTTEQHLHGKVGTVIVPTTFQTKGRVKVEVSSEVVFLTAQSFQPQDTFANGDSVVVVEVRDGIAYISAFHTSPFPKFLPPTA